jgi:hypothetical protein
MFLKFLVVASKVNCQNCGGYYFFFSQFIILEVAILLLTFGAWILFGGKIEHQMMNVYSNHWRRVLYFSIHVVFLSLLYLDVIYRLRHSSVFYLPLE